MSSEGEAFRELAALLRAGHPLRAALRSWPETCAEGSKQRVAVFARRVALGQPPEAAAAASPMLANLGVALSVHRSTGANLAIVLDGLARWHDDCAALAGRARASSAGALLSARLVAALPLVALPLLPAARAPILDGPGVISLVLGLALMALGMKWMKRLVPTAWHEPDLALMVATLAAAALAGGARLRPSLQAIACAVGGSADLTRAEKRVRLGQNWSGALQATGDPALARLGHLIERIERTGAPAGAALSDWADARSTQLATGFEARVARAPVKLVVPLTLCVLPAFGLVGVLPFLRALAAP